MMIRIVIMIGTMIMMVMTMVRFRSMEDLGGKQEKTAGWELVRLLRFDPAHHGYEDQDQDHHHHGYEDQDQDQDHDHGDKGGDEGNDAW